jgi:hypothetical protein
LISDDTFVDICDNIDLCVKDSISGLAIREVIQMEMAKKATSTRRLSETAVACMYGDRRLKGSCNNNS